MRDGSGGDLVTQRTKKHPQRFDFINLVEDGDRVFVTYEGQGMNGEVFRNTEIVTVRDSRVVEVEVYFGWSIPHKAEPGTHLAATGEPAHWSPQTRE